MIYLCNHRIYIFLEIVFFTGGQDSSPNFLNEEISFKNSSNNKKDQDLIIDSWTGGPPSNDDLAEKNSQQQQQSFYSGNMRMVEQEQPKEPTGWGAPPPSNPNGWGQPPPKIGNWQQPPPNVAQPPPQTQQTVGEIKVLVVCIRDQTHIVTY